MEIKCELSKIIIDEKRQDQIIVLREKDGERQFPIVIGFLEASSIKMKISNVEPPRPMTHDLLIATIKAMGGNLEKLVVDKLLNNTFHAKLYIKTKDQGTVTIDARPSDGVALAVRVGAGIFVEEEVLKKASIFKME
ncbi:MAG TPA: bifunctional nuclease family protein [Candidatus Omnitrophota bacterium]|nr:bifunctional nuclease family protein [Candidatus Omnitrophota bacterium]